jgi:hypothetical protein
VIARAHIRTGIILAAVLCSSTQQASSRPGEFHHHADHCPSESNLGKLFDRITNRCPPANTSSRDGQQVEKPNSNVSPPQPTPLEKSSK